MSLSSEESVYDLWSEDSLEITPGIGDKLEAIPNFLQFYWRMKEPLKETSKTAIDLKKEHGCTLMGNMFNSSSCLNSLSLTVHPSILRLMKKKIKLVWLI